VSGCCPRCTCGVGGPVEVPELQITDADVLGRAVPWSSGDHRGVVGVAGDWSVLQEARAMKSSGSGIGPWRAEENLPDGPIDDPAPSETTQRLKLKHTSLRAAR
jgi:hypothetical protein